jgi:hypothetical protein
MGRHAIRRFDKSLAAYERWLASELDELWKADLKLKHEKMRESAFVFLRATYWRWAETILTICEDLATAPAVIGIGDIHLENYGVWRDQEGRLVWGINDLDEAADMPYAVDLVRLATSAMLSLAAKRRARKEISANILEGYRAGLATPRPFVLDEEHLWLRRLFAVSEGERRHFWKKMDKLSDDPRITDRYRKPIESRQPEPDATIEIFARRSAGTGSLGRPRWVALGRWRGGRFVREAKAIVPSAWYLAHRQRARGRPAASIAAGRHRAPDPWYQTQRDVVVRRLSPNARKIEVQEHAGDLADAAMLRAMGYELANVHLGTADIRKAIEKDLAQRGDDWLVRSAKTASEFVSADFEEWRG